VFQQNPKQDIDDRICRLAAPLTDPFGLLTPLHLPGREVMDAAAHGMDPWQPPLRSRRVTDKGPGAGDVPSPAACTGVDGSAQPKRGTVWFQKKYEQGMMDQAAVKLMKGSESRR
jgi:hypothetical protein